MRLVLQRFFKPEKPVARARAHQQGWIRRGKASYGGIDVSKDRLDVVVLPEGWSLREKRQSGWTELGRKGCARSQLRNGLEPSGGYERGIIRLARARRRLRRINPTSFGRSLAPAASCQ